jgi:uncharacterized surface protein with fasciclin (FAS1) repeats
MMLMTSCLMSLFWITCNENVGDDYVTFREDTVFSFLESEPELYSDFVEMLKISDVSDLLSAYGTYTCFAPTNDAMKAYYEQNGTSLQEMSTEDIRELVFNHVIAQEILSLDFPQGTISAANLSERFLTVSYTVENEQTAIYINKSARIAILDQKVHNGVVHTVDNVILLSNDLLAGVISLDPRLSLFSEALHLTRMSDSMYLIKEEGYKERRVTTVVDTGDLGHNWITPPFLKYGYTAFVESDSLYAENGIFNIEDLKKYAAEVYDKMYPEDKNVTDVTDRRNSLNRFVSYHLMDRMQSANEFIPPSMTRCYIPRTILYEYMESMCPNTLIMVQNGVVGAESGKIYFNRRKSGWGIQILDSNTESLNGVYHEIDQIMVYDETMETDVLNRKIRIDAGSIFPEIATNKLRLTTYCMYYMPVEYLKKNLTCADGTETFYKVNAAWQNIGNDEFIIGNKYDFIMRIPPIPAGTYEVRFRYNEAGEQRGVAQVYFDGEPCGIPMDLRIAANNPKIGYIADSQTDDNGVENDKMMRNRGWMKDINSAYIGNYGSIARNAASCIRKILVTKTFDKTESHYLRIKVVEERIAAFQLDYLEFVPTYFLENEGRD